MINRAASGKIAREIPRGRRGALLVYNWTLLPLRASGGAVVVDHSFGGGSILVQRTERCKLYKQNVKRGHNFHTFLAGYIILKEYSQKV